MHWSERLSEYLDGELSASERAACDAHLTGCGQCRAVLEELQLVTKLAKADRDVMPVSDLWAGILTRIAAPKQSAATESGSFFAPIPFAKKDPDSVAAKKISFTFTLPQLALAASLLIAVSSAVAYMAAQRIANRPAPVEAPIQAVAEPVMPPSADVTPANFADAQFDRAVADLEQILAEARDTLDPGTVMVIERNLAAIDEAIRQARAALDADPANPFLNTHLAEARRRKLDLLRHAADISSSGD